MDRSLLKQAKSEKRKREIAQLLSEYKNLSPSMIIKRLLPLCEIQPKQELFLNSIAPDSYAIGGYGAGKTYLFCMKAIYLNWVNRPYPVLLITQTKGNANATTIETLNEILDANEISYTKKEDPTYTIYEIDWGDSKGIFKIASGYDASALKGPNMAACGIDEAFIIKKEVIGVVASRARHPKAKVNEVFYSGTPEPLKMDWGFDIIENDYTGDDKTFKITLSLDDNKFASQENKDRIKRMFDPQMQEVYYHGRYHSLTGETVYRFQTKKNKRTYEDLPYIPDLSGIVQLGIGFDFNVSPMTAGLIWLDNNIAKQIDEYMIDDSNTSELCELIHNRLQEQYPGITGDNRLKYSIMITMDASAKQRRSSAAIGVTDAKTVKSFFETRGYQCYVRIPNENPPVRDRINYVNNLLDKEAFVIYSNCKNSILDRTLTQWKGNYDGFKIKKTGGRSHISEAVDYILWLLQTILGYEFYSGTGKTKTGPRRRKR